MTRPTVLILIGAYWPGHEATGPNLSIRALCEGLADAFDFGLVARDRGFGDAAALVDGARWNALGYARIRYLPPARVGMRGLSRLIRETPHDLLVLNGFFDRDFTIPALIARRLGRIPSKPALLSPRGEFSGGALGLKSGRKALYRRLVATAGLLDGVTLHATSAAEAADIGAAFPTVPLRRIENFRPLPLLPDFVERDVGEPLRVAFVGRISPVKGLDAALKALALVETPVRFDIFGPIGDAAHWRDCQALIARLPSHVAVSPRGAITNEAVIGELARRDLMLLPSLSENFGHAIFESLAAGTPVLIGDQTPWRGLAEAKAGFDLALGDHPAFAKAIDRLARMEAGERDAWRRGARAFAERHAAANDAADEMRALLDEMIDR